MIKKSIIQIILILLGNNEILMKTTNRLMNIVLEDVECWIWK